MLLCLILCCHNSRTQMLFIFVLQKEAFQSKVLHIIMGEQTSSLSITMGVMLYQMDAAGFHQEEVCKDVHCPCTYYGSRSQGERTNNTIALVWAYWESLRMLAILSFQHVVGILLARQIVVLLRMLRLMTPAATVILCWWCPGFSKKKGKKRGQIGNHGPPERVNIVVCHTSLGAIWCTKGQESKCVRPTLIN